MYSRIIWLGKLLGASFVSRSLEFCRPSEDEARISYYVWISAKTEEENADVFVTIYANVILRILA